MIGGFAGAALGLVSLAMAIGAAIQMFTHLESTVPNNAGIGVTAIIGTFALLGLAASGRLLRRVEYRQCEDCHAKLDAS